MDANSMNDYVFDNDDEMDGDNFTENLFYGYSNHNKYYREHSKLRQQMAHRTFPMKHEYYLLQY